jgi:hypothetical protein
VARVWGRPIVDTVPPHWKRSQMRGERLVGLVFAAYVAATALHIGFVVAHEPFSFDAWNVAVDTGAKPFSLSRFFEYWQFEYVHANPRLGQPLTYLAYKLQWFAEVATPLAFLALTLAITVLGLGRWPRKSRELALWSIVIGFCWFALPQIGRNMFCRAYAANYVYAAAFQLWFLVPLRLDSVRPAPPSRERYASYAMFGVLAGMCNEHTGPVLIALLAGYGWWIRRERAQSRLAFAGAAGALVGFLLLFFAPGQGERYGGLAQQLSLPERILDRGVEGVVELLGDYLLYAAPLLALLVLVLVYAHATPRAEDDADARRIAGRLVYVAIAIGLLVVGVLCASPKLGSRFFIVPCAVLLAAFVAVVDTTVTSRRVFAPLVVLAVVASIYAAARTIPLYRSVADQGAARMAQLEASTPGASIVVTPWQQVRETWWFIGDDFRDAKKRAMVAHYFALAKVTLQESSRRRR